MKHYQQGGGLFARLFIRAALLAAFVLGTASADNAAPRPPP